MGELTSAAKRKAKQRANKRKQGFISKTAWILPQHEKKFLKAVTRYQKP